MFGRLLREKRRGRGLLFRWREGQSLCRGRGVRRVGRYLDFVNLMQVQGKGDAYPSTRGLESRLLLACTVSHLHMVSLEFHQL